MKRLGSLSAATWVHHPNYYARKRTIYVADDLRRNVQTKCYGLPVRFAGNIRHLCDVYGTGVTFVNADSKKMGFTIHRATLWRMEHVFGFTLSLLYCSYVENYFKQRFGCNVSVGEMLAYDLSSYPRYSKAVLNPTGVKPAKIKKT